MNIGEGVESVKFVDLLDAVHTQTVVVKIDIEGHECRVNKLIKLYVIFTFSCLKKNNIQKNDTNSDFLIPLSLHSMTLDILNCELC